MSWSHAPGLLPTCACCKTGNLEQGDGESEGEGLRNGVMKRLDENGERDREATEAGEQRCQGWRGGHSHMSSMACVPAVCVTHSISDEKARHAKQTFMLLPMPRTRYCWPVLAGPYFRVVVSGLET
jgi:hypothetical protein